MLFLLAKEAAGVQRSHGVGLLAAAARGGHHGGTREALLTSIGALDAYAEACRAAAPVWVDAVRLDALLRPPADCLELQAMLLEPSQLAGYMNANNRNLSPARYMALMTSWMDNFRQFETQLVAHLRGTAGLHPEHGLTDLSEPSPESRGGASAGFGVSGGGGAGFGVSGGGGDIGGGGNTSGDGDGDSASAVGDGGDVAGNRDIILADEGQYEHSADSGSDHGQDFSREPSPRTRNGQPLLVDSANAAVTTPQASESVNQSVDRPVDRGAGRAVQMSSTTFLPPTVTNISLSELEMMERIGEAVLLKFYQINNFFILLTSLQSR